MLRVAQQWWNHGWNPLETCRSDQFPGSQPISIERKHLQNLTNKEYAVCEKADGERVFAMWHDGKSVLIDRRCQIREFRVKGAPPKFMDGTLLDCELTATNLLVFDAARVCGEPCSNKHLWERQALIKKWTSRCLRVKGDPFVIKMKPHWPMTDTTAFIRWVTGTKVSWGIDGLIFTPVAHCLDSGTIDFHLEVGATPTTWKLFLQARGVLVFQEEVWSDSPLMKGGSIVEFRWEDGWKAFRARPDKSKPNGVFTFQRTIINIKEGITDDELLSLDKPSQIGYLKCNDE